MAETDKPNLVDRVRTYASFLEEKLKEEEQVAGEESIRGSIGANQRWSIYRSAQKELYRLFPELESPIR